MLIFKRHLATNGLRFKNAASSSLRSILHHSCFDPIRENLPTDTINIDPYVLSQKINETLMENKTLNSDQTANIHNHLIEHLTNFEYGIATLHSQKLDALNKPVTIQALSQMLKYNPGRVSSSWEIFVKYKKLLNLLPDEIVTTTLNKVVNFDPVEIKDGKKDLNSQDILHAIYLLNMLNDSGAIDQSIIDKLTCAAIKLPMTSVLPLLFEFNPSLNAILDEQLEQLTPYQIYLTAENFSFAALEGHKELFYRIVDTLGQNDFISMNEEELDMAEKTKKNIDFITKLLDENWDLHLAKTKINSRFTFNDLLDHIAENSLAQKDLKIAKKVLRIIGVFKGDIKSLVELYELFIDSFPDGKDQLKFEAFLGLAYQRYKTSNENAAQFGEAFVSDVTDEAIKIKVLCVQMVVNAKSDLHKSLDLYNENISKLSKEKDPTSNMSHSDLATHALILAFLSQKDLDFARVIVEGSIKAEAMSGATAVKNAKEMLAAYGEALEAGNLDSMLEERVVKYLQSA